MTLARLKLLRDNYAFDATPKFNDVGVYHVPFESMSAGTPVERRFRDGALRGERIALIGDSGCGKTSLVSYVLGPTAESVAPILSTGPFARARRDQREPDSRHDHLATHPSSPRGRIPHNRHQPHHRAAAAGNPHKQAQQRLERATPGMDGTRWYRRADRKTDHYNRTEHSRRQD